MMKRTEDKYWIRPGLVVGKYTGNVLVKDGVIIRGRKSSKVPDGKDFEG